MRLALVLTCLLGLSGCSFELRPVQYDRDVNYQSGQTGSLQLVSFSKGKSLDQLFDVGRENGAVEYSTAGISSGQVNFDVLDERIFAESLASELTRKGLVNIHKVSEQVDTRKYLSVQLVFTKVVFEHSFGPDFQIEAALQLRTPNNEVRKLYKTSTFENGSAWARMNTDGQEAKGLVAQNLMNKIIPDIETFLQLDAAGAKKPL